jgi:hypothetical protein
MMRKFSYKGIAIIGVLLTQFGGVFSIALATLASIGIIALSLAPNSNPNASRVTLACLIVWTLLIDWSVGLSLLNMYPTIWMDESGLVISVLFFGRARIPWGEIVAIKRKWEMFGDYLVQARHITPMHSLIGWNFSQMLYPSFLIGHGLEGRDELISEIKKRIPSR